MIAIDVHAHLVLREALDAMEAAHPGIGHEVVDGQGDPRVRDPVRETLVMLPAAMFDVDRRLADMDRQRVDVQVLAVPPRQYHYDAPAPVGADFARIQNDALLEVSDRHPERFHVFLTLPLQDIPASIAELGRAHAHPRVRGVEIGTNVVGRNLDDAAFEPLWGALVDAELPVWVHPGQIAMAGRERLGSYHLVNLIGNPLESTIAIASVIFGGVLERHPALRFGFVHGGGFAPYQTGRWDHGWGCRPEAREVIAVRPTEYFNRLFFDSLTHDRASLELLGRRVGWEQVVVGSDYPFDMGSDDPVGAVEELGLPPDLAQGVLSANAERFLRPVRDSLPGGTSPTGG